MWGGFLNPRRSQECERGTQECVRYEAVKKWQQPVAYARGRHSLKRGVNNWSASGDIRIQRA